MSTFIIVIVVGVGWVVAISKLYSTENWKTALMAKQNNPVGPQ